MKKLHRWRHALTHSLRVRLVALFLLLAAGMAGVFLLGMQTAFSIGWRDAARPLVSDYVDRLVSEIGSPPSVERAQALVDRLPVRVRISGPLVNWSSQPESPDYERRWRNEEPRLLERVTADGHRISLGLHITVWSDRPRYIGWATLAALLLLTALAYWRVRRMLRPLDDIRTGAQRFGAGDFEQAIPIRHPGHPDELEDLAGTINTMAQDIREMLDAKRTLLLAISHELRSPLTRARLHTELLPETPDVGASREALLADLALMRDLVTDLLESERLSQRHAALLREPVNLAELVGDVAQSLQSTGRVQQELAADIPPMSVDPVRIRVLVRNLLDNALRHSAGAAQPPCIRLSAIQQGGVTLVVRDFGTGVAPDQIDKLAQPFYRPDADRGRASGGVGLGLHLCKLIALAHGGTFRIANAEPGLEITVTLP